MTRHLPSHQFPLGLLEDFGERRREVLYYSLVWGKWQCVMAILASLDNSALCCSMNYRNHCLFYKSLLQVQYMLQVTSGLGGEDRAMVPRKGGQSTMFA